MVYFRHFHKIATERSIHLLVTFGGKIFSLWGMTRKYVIFVSEHAQSQTRLDKHGDLHRRIVSVGRRRNDALRGVQPERELQERRGDRPAAGERPLDTLNEGFWGRKRRLSPF